MIKPTALAVLAAAVFGTTLEAEAASIKNLACYEGQRNPFAAPETKQFEFLIGAFEAKLFPFDAEAGDWADEPSTVALWEGEYILDGTGIADYWFGTDPAANPEAGRGVNTRIFNPESGTWHMTWNTWGQNHRTTVLTARMIDGVLTMWQTYPEPDRKQVSEFILESPDHWTRYTYLEEGDQRTPFYKIEARRLPCQE